MLQVFHNVSEMCSRTTTEEYSTSFSSAIKLLHQDLRQPIFNIYGFVRFADEIVDTFHEYDKTLLLEQFKTETFEAINRKISLNPILHSFQRTVNEYNIDRTLIDSFFTSMKMDLDKKKYSCNDFREYIYGSAEVVGLMCLFVFCEGKKDLYEKLRAPACSLGAAFQKVNFLRDLKADYDGMSRIYFPGCDFNNFTPEEKMRIESDIQHDFNEARLGIMQLPLKARFGVYVAYKYYLTLFKKIKKLQPTRILEARVRIPKYHKLMIVMRAGVKNQLNLI